MREQAARRAGARDRSTRERMPPTQSSAAYVTRSCSGVSTPLPKLALRRGNRDRFGFRRQANLVRCAEGTGAGVETPSRTRSPRVSTSAHAATRGAAPGISEASGGARPRPTKLRGARRYLNDGVGGWIFDGLCSVRTRSSTRLALANEYRGGDYRPAATGGEVGVAGVVLGRAMLVADQIDVDQTSRRRIARSAVGDHRQQVGA